MSDLLAGTSGFSEESTAAFIASVKAAKGVHLVALVDDAVVGCRSVLHGLNFSIDGIHDSWTISTAMKRIYPSSICVCTYVVKRCTIKTRHWQN